MTATTTKTISQLEFDTTYESDFKGLHRELMVEFESDNPTYVILSASGFSQTNEDDTITYTLTIEYELA